MPFDGTEFNEVTEQLKTAKQVLIKTGWCIGARIDNLGRRCALGVLDAVIGERSEANCSVINRLADAVPDNFITSYQKASRVAEYNNSQTDIKPILEWFDRAIG